MMRTFGERNPLPIGIIGSLIVALLLGLALDLKNLPFIGRGHTYHAIFSEGGGIGAGDEVDVSGIAVGTVSSVKLVHGTVDVTFTVTDSHAHLGDRTGAAIVTLTVLGKRGLSLTSAGEGSLAHGATIPLDRTTAPYDLTDALSGLTTTTAQIDTAQAAKAINTLSGVLAQTPTGLTSTISGLSRISQTVASRDQAIAALLKASSQVSGVLASRDAQIANLLGSGSALMAELNARRAVIEALLRDATALSKTLLGLVAANQPTLKHTLDQVNAVVALLNKNKENLDLTLQRAAPFASALGESVGTGPFFDAYVCNLTQFITMGNNPQATDAQRQCSGT